MNWQYPVWTVTKFHPHYRSSLIASKRSMHTDPHGFKSKYYSLFATAFRWTVSQYVPLYSNYGNFYIKSLIIQ